MPAEDGGAEAKRGGGYSAGLWVAARALSSSRMRASAARRAAASSSRASSSSRWERRSSPVAGSRSRTLRASRSSRSSSPSTRHPPVRQHRHRRQRPVLAFVQPKAPQRRREVLRPRVVEEVLTHPERGIELAFAPLVGAPCALRRHLQHEVRPLGLVPQQVRVAKMRRRSHHHVHVRGHHRAGVAPLVVEEVVRADVHVSLPALLEPPPECGGHVHHARGVKVGLSHGLAVGAGVEDGIVGEAGMAHGRVLRVGAGASSRSACRSGR